jgi:hypothetical protein
MGEVIVVWLGVRDVHKRGDCAFFCDGFNEESRVTNIVLIIDSKALRIRREYCILRSADSALSCLGNLPDDGRSKGTSIVESIIPNRQ